MTLYPFLLFVNIDDFVKSRKTPFFVIPAEAGIQSFQMVTDGLDSGYRIESGTSFAGVTTFYEFINIGNISSPLSHIVTFDLYRTIVTVQTIKRALKK